MTIVVIDNPNGIYIIYLRNDHAQLLKHGTYKTARGALACVERLRAQGHTIPDHYLDRIALT